MEIKFTVHAENRIAARKLSWEQVAAVALHPEQIVQDEGKLPIAQSRIVFMDKPYLLRVVYRDENGVRWIITVYPTSQIEKYWRKE